MTFYAPSNTNAPFLPTTINYPSNPEELLIRLNKAYEDIATRLNVKQIGVFDLSEFLTGEQWFTSGNPQIKRQTFRTVFNIGAIATGATLNTAHGLTGITAFTHIYGSCITSVPDFRPIPYASVAATNAQIEIKVNSTDIIIINGAGSPNLTSCIVVLEYLKN